MKTIYKFRAWDNKENCWYKNELSFYGFAIFGECTMLYTPPVDYLQHLVITQYTGLKDCNGKEIYEGDVIKYNVSLDGKIKDKGVVKYLTNKAMFGLSPNGLHELSGVEIIGNIYENSELLK